MKPNPFIRWGLVSQLLVVVWFASIALSVTNRYTDGNLSATCSGSTYSIASRNCTGSDGTGYKTIAEGLRALGAGDLLYLRAGTYAMSGNYGNVATDTYGTSSSWATATRIQNYPGEAVICNCTFVMRANTYSPAVLQYVIFEGDVPANFVINGGDGQLIANGTNKIRFKNTTIQNSTGNGALVGGVPAPDGVEFIGNRFLNNGNETNQEHGLYYGNSTNGLAERNYIFQSQGYGFQAQANPSLGHSNSNLTVTGNVVEGRKAAGTGAAGCIVVNAAAGSGNKVTRNLCIGQGTAGKKYDIGIQFGGGQSNLTVYNNTVYDVATCLQLNTGSGTNKQVKNNILDNCSVIAIEDLGTGATKSFNLCEVDGCGGSSSNTIVTATPGFVSAGTDFSLAVGSAAINACTPISGFPSNGNPDCGAFETFTYASATVNENFLDTTYGMNLNTPILPASGATGVTALVAAVARTTTATSKLSGSDSVLRTTFNGAVCAGGETWTTTYVPGNVTDSALIGGTMNQKALGYTAQAVTNNCGTAPPAPPAGLHIHYLLDDNTGTNANDATANNLDGTLSGIFAWVVGKLGFGFLLTDATDGSLAIPYGNAVNPSTQSLTVAFWVNVPANVTSAYRVYFGHAGTADNRFYISTQSSTWRLGIQSSNDASGASNLAVTEGWNRVCLVANSGLDTAVLTVNGTVGTTGAAKAYTSYAFPSNLTLGSPFGAGYSPGVTYDDFKLWTSAESCADDWAAAEPPAPPAAIVLTQKRHQFMESHYLPGTTTVQLLGAQQAAISKFAGESFALVTQTDATVAGGSIGQRLHYKRNGGAAQPVTDDCTTADQFCFVGNQTDPTDLLAGTVTCCLTGALTAIHGDTQISMDAVPVTPFTINSSTVHRRVLKFGVAAVATDTYDLFEYTQQGIAFGTYDPVGGARVTVAGTAPGITAPTNLHFSGPANSSLAAIIWSPVAHSAWAGTYIYRSTTSGVYSTVPTYTNTVSGMLAAHSPLTQRNIRLPVAGTYYFVAKAFDVDGNLSAASSEVSRTVAGESARAARQ